MVRPTLYMSTTDLGYKRIKTPIYQSKPYFAHPLPNTALGIPIEKIVGMCLNCDILIYNSFNF